MKDAVPHPPGVREAFASHHEVLDLDPDNYSGLRSLPGSRGDKQAMVSGPMAWQSCPGVVGGGAGSPGGDIAGGPAVFRRLDCPLLAAFHAYAEGTRPVGEAASNRPSDALHGWGG